MKTSIALATAVLLATSAHAGRSGIWEGFADDEIIGTQVTNDEDNTFAFLCVRKGTSCTWVLTLNLSCDENAKMPVLGASRLGAMHLTLGCVGPSKDKKRFMYTIDEYKRVFDLIAKGGEVGFAVAKDTGQFVAFRFNADGASQSIRNVADALPQSNKQPTTSTF